LDRPAWRRRLIGLKEELSGIEKARTDKCPGLGRSESRVALVDNCYVVFGAKLSPPDWTTI
jgi:hypothetical protein